MKTGEAMAGFLASRKAMRLSPRTVSWYAGMLKPFTLQHQELPKQPEPIEAFLGALDGVSDETVHGAYRALRAFYRWHWARHNLAGRTNPMRDKQLPGGVRAPQRRRKKPYSLTMAELGWLLAAPLSPRDRALISLLVDTGLRISEVVNLVAADIQEDSILVDGKTGEREVPISAETRAQLLALAERGSMFKGPRGRLTRSGGYRIVRLAMARAGIDARKRGPHTLRHTFGRQYIVAGGDLVSLQRILGHSNIQTTRIYAELDLRDITIQHHRFSPLKGALAMSQMDLWGGRRADFAGPLARESPAVEFSAGQRL